MYKIYELDSLSECDSEEKVDKTLFDIGFDSTDVTQRSIVLTQYMSDRQPMDWVGMDTDSSSPEEKYELILKKLIIMNKLDMCKKDEEIDNIFNSNNINSDVRYRTIILNSFMGVTQSYGFGEITINEEYSLAKQQLTTSNKRRTLFD